MEYTRLGSTGLPGSRICLGMMSYGSPRWRAWVLDLDAARPLVRAAAEAGITCYDTPDMYSVGVSGEVTGALLCELFAHRDDYVLATKVVNPMGEGPNCLETGIGVTPSSPPARWVLAGNSTREQCTTTRSRSDRIAVSCHGTDTYADADFAVVDAVRGVAHARGLPPAQIAPAWLLHRPVPTAPIGGATKAAHIEDAVAAVDVALSDEEIATLEAPYVTRPGIGH